MQKCFSLKYFFLNEVQKTLIIKKNKHKNACSFFIGFQEQTYKHTFAKAPCGTFTPIHGCGISLREQRESTTVSLRFLSQNLNLCPHSGVAKKSKMTS